MYMCAGALLENKGNSTTWAARVGVYFLPFWIHSFIRLDIVHGDELLHMQELGNYAD